jgi:HTH-type transcriptional regulator/antitoxin HigA
METLKYTIIKNKEQYSEYCKTLEGLVFASTKKTYIEEEIDLLTLLIEKWDADHSTFPELDPVQLLNAFLKSHELKAKDLVDILGISKGYVSDILNYKKGFSKVVIRKLAEHFKVNQEAFNRPYKLAAPANLVLKNDSSRNIQKAVSQQLV